MLYYLLGTVQYNHAQKSTNQSTHEVCVMTDKKKKKRKIKFEGDLPPTEQIQEKSEIKVGKQQQL